MFRFPLIVKTDFQNKTQIPVCFVFSFDNVHVIVVTSCSCHIPSVYIQPAIFHIQSSRKAECCIKCALC